MTTSPSLLGASIRLGELLHRLVRGEAAVDVAFGIGRDAFRHLLRARVADEGGHLAVLDAADADALPEGLVELFARLRVGDIDHVILVDEHAARAAELLPLGDELAVLVEDLQAVVLAVGDEESACLIHGEAVRRLELAGGGALAAPGGDELALFGELHDA